jgi:hypothetical protein
VCHVTPERVRRGLKLQEREAIWISRRIEVPTDPRDHILSC